MGYAFLLILLSVAAGQAPTRDQQSIRQTDFKNFTYRPDCLGEDKSGKPESVRARDGSYQRWSGDDQVYFEVLGTVYGDLTGDGKEEALVRTLCNTGGTGQFTDGIIFTLQQGRPVPVATLGIGDRADGGIHDVRIENGLLKVARYGGTSGACCPDYIETYTFRLQNGRLVAVGKPARSDYTDREGYRSVRRIQFQKGSTSATVKGSTTGMAEYLLGARAGQTLTLRVSGANLSLRLMAPDGADLGPPVPNTPLSVKLPATGDYRIAVEAAQNKTEFTIEVTIR
jgi:hypothetical protein